MKKLMVTAIMAVVTMGFIACKKENSTENNNGPITGLEPVRNALSANAWEFSEAAVIYGPGNEDRGPLDNCKQDDRYFFALGGNATVTHGNNPCVPGIAETNGLYANWQLGNNGQTLTMTYTRDMPGGFVAGDVLNWTVDFISANKLVIKRLEVEPGKTYTVVETYVKN
jgi:hypothetical protein